MKKNILTSIFVVLGLAASAHEPSGTMPILHIETEGLEPIVSKTDYLTAGAWLEVPENVNAEPFGSAAEPVGLLIKGRGNFSWLNFDKKPYRLKFDKKISPCGLDKSRHFALLANADDSSYLKNSLGFELSRVLGLDWTPSQTPVEVILNGDYIGLYMLTETIRAAKDRVNITEQEEGETDPDLVTGGWIVEKDNYNDSENITVRDCWFSFKTPEDLTPQQTEYITGQVEAIFSTLEKLRDDPESTEWMDLIDLDRAARFYVVQEFMDNWDAYNGSCYFFKDRDVQGEPQQKWKFGPVWDMSNCLRRGKTGFIYETTKYPFVFIQDMVLSPAFQQKVAEVIAEFFADGSYDYIFSFLDTKVPLLRDAVLANAKRWYGNHELNWDVVHTNNFVSSNLHYSIHYTAQRYGVDVDDNYKLRHHATLYDNGEEPWTRAYAYIFHFPPEGRVDLTSWNSLPMTQVAPRQWEVELETSPGRTLHTPLVVFNNGSNGPDDKSDAYYFGNNGVYTRIYENPMAGVGSLPAPDRGCKVYVENGTIVIEATQASSIGIADVTGMNRIIKVQEGRNVVDWLPRGLYIVEGKKLLL